VLKAQEFQPEGQVLDQGQEGEGGEADRQLWKESFAARRESGIRHLTESWSGGRAAKP